MSRVIIGVDHKWRDLPDRVYLAHLLERRGHEVFLTRNGFERGASLVHRADAVVVNHVYSNARQEDLAHFHALGVRVAVVPTEGMGMIAQLRKLIAGGYHRFQGVDLMTTWNDEIRNLTLELKSIDSARLVTTGAPRFDFYAEPLSKLLKSREQFCGQYGLRPDWPTVTLATNFTQADVVTSDRRMKAYVSDSLRMSLDKAMPWYREIPRMEYDTRELLLKAVRRLAGDARSINIVLRPHPSENHLFYEEFASRLTQSVPACRVALPIQEYFWDVLAATSVLVQRSCVTGYEGWHRGLPVVELRLNQKEWYTSEDHALGCDVVTNEGSFLERIAHYVGGGSVPESQANARRGLLRRQFGPLDGCAISRTSDAIDGLLRGSSPVPYPASLRHTWMRCKYALRTMGDFCISDLKAYGFGSHDRFGHRDRFIHFSDIPPWKERFRALEIGQPSPASLPSAGV